jgi:hypothetical protein
MAFNARLHQRCPQVCYCRIRSARHQRLHNRERTKDARVVQFSYSKTILRVHVVLAPVLDEPVCDCGFAAVDGEEQRCHLIIPLFLQHRRVRQHVLLHRLHILPL